MADPSRHLGRPTGATHGAPGTLFSRARRRRHRRWLTGFVALAACALALVVASSGLTPGYPAGRSGAGATPHDSSGAVPPETVPPVHAAPESGPSRPHLATFAFFDPTLGYGIFVQGSGHGCQEEVGRTANGGATFGPLVTVAPCATLGRHAGVAFDDHGDGFVFDRSSRDLYVTHDSGTAWKPDPQRGDVLSVEALGYSIWMLEAQCHAQGTSGAKACTLSVLESANGGRTWEATASLGASGSAVASDASVAGAPGSLVRVGQDVAYVLGHPEASSTPGETSVPLWYTGDAGRSWTLRTVPCGLGAADTARMSAAPTGQLFAVCAGTKRGGDQEKAVAVSANGGLGWTEAGTCAHVAGARCAAAGLGVGYLGQVNAVSATVAYIFGPRGPLDETTDAGASWTPIVTRFAHPGPEAMAFFNASDGVVGTSSAGGYEVWHTVDGGSAWTAVDPKVQTIESALPRAPQALVADRQPT